MTKADGYEKLTQLANKPFLKCAVLTVSQTPPRSSNSEGLNGIRTLTSAMPVQCSTSWALRPLTLHVLLCPTFQGILTRCKRTVSQAMTAKEQTKIINNYYYQYIRGQIENRPLQNTRSTGRKRLTAGCECIIGPTADWFLLHHPTDFNQLE